MTTITLKIDERSKKGKHLLGLIREIAKEEPDIQILYHSPNQVTLDAMEDAEKGSLYELKNVDDLFDKV